MPSRRTLLRVVAGSTVPLSVAGAGCVGDDSGTTPTGDDANATPTATPTEMRGSPSPTSLADCSESVRPEVPEADENDGVDPRQYPELPEDLTASSAEFFVERFERAYVVNRAIERTDLSDLEFVSWRVEGSSEVNAGYRVTVGGHLAEYTGGPTSTYHGDVWYTAVYLVTPQRVWRNEGGEDVDPTDGVMLVCSPDG